MFLFSLLFKKTTKIIITKEHRKESDILLIVYQGEILQNFKTLTRKYLIMKFQKN